MKIKGLRIEVFGQRTICIGGVGKMFYQDGFPIGMAITELSKKGIETSIYHVVDELLKNGWTNARVINTLRAEAGDDPERQISMSDVEHFCISTYEQQREMIFQYLFGNAANARAWAEKNVFV